MGAMNGAGNGAGEEKVPLEKKPVSAADDPALDLAMAEKEEETKDDATAKKGKEAKAKTPAVPLWKLYSRADSIDVLLMTLGATGAICLGAAMPCLSLLFGQLTNSFGQATDPSDISASITTVALRFTWVGLGAAAAAYLEVTCWMLTGERQAARLRAQFLAAILRQEVAYFDKSTNTGAVIGHMSGDILTIQEAMGEKVGTFLRFFATFLGGFAVAFASGWQLTLVMLAALPLLAVCGATMTFVISRSTTRGQEAYSEAGSVVEECVGAIRTVLAFTGENKAVEQYNKKLDKAYHAGVQSSLATGLGIGATMLVMFSSYGLALWYGATLILQGTGYTGGTVMTVLFGVIIGGMSLGQAGPSLATLAQGQAAAYKIFEVLERKPDIDSGDLSGKTLEAVKGAVEMQKVVFSYPSRPDVRIFDDFSLAIPAGGSVALVGESGSGKSTVIALIERFYDPQEGAVLLDGVDIQTLQLKWLREQLALVSQEPVLFHTTIRGNISYGRSTPLSEDELVQACSRANIHSFIQSLPEGYDTEVGERGTQLSGGQKQRIAIARALVRDPRVLLLDEATSALDAESEKVVQHALDSIMAGRTTVIVAHRLSTVRKADMIAVMQHGQVVETGKHSSLIADPSSAYYQLVHLQESHMRGTDTEVTEVTEAAQPSDGHADAPPADTTKGGAAAAAPSAALGEEAAVAGGLPGVAMPLPLSTNGSAAAAQSEAAPAAGTAGTEGSVDVEMGEAQEKVVVKGGGSFGGRAAKSLRRRLSTKGGHGGKGHAWKEGMEEAEEEEEEEAPGPNVSLSRVLPLNKPEWPLAVLAVLAAVGNGLMFPVFSILLSHIIPVFYEPDPAVLRKNSNFWAVMFVVLAVSVFFLMVAQNFLFGVIGSRLIRRVRRLCFSAVLRQEVAWFDERKNSSGAIGARLSMDAAQVRAMVGDRLALVVQNIATICAGMVIAFTACWQLALVVLSVVPLLVIAGSMQMKALMGFSENAKVMFEDASRVANDAVGNIRTVAAFGSEDKVMQLYHDKCSLPLKAGSRKAFVSGFGMAFSQFVMFANYSLAFWYGGQLVEQGVTTFQSVFQVFFAIVLSAMGVAQSAGLAPDVVTVQTAVNSIFRILDRQSAIDPEAPGQSLSEPQGVVEMRDVHFSYPLRPDIRIFQGLTLTIPAGQTVALVGQSGSGKSTVVALVERFYDPTAGAVLLDGVDIKTLQLKWLRQQLALVNQEPTLFNVSIRENIMYGRNNASEAEVVEAAKAANAHSFVSALPEGYDTMVGERGVQLSGGQKQRIAIARAVLKDPRVLLLDEATSALDAESESVVQEALERVMVGRTTIVIAHRLATVVNSDKIAVMQAGHVVEEGTHKQLLALSGVYASLASLQ